MVLAIVLSSAYGLYKRPDVTVPEGGVKLDESLSTAVFEQYVVDQANILSGKTEDMVSLYNANWDRMAGSILAVVTTNPDGAETADDRAWEWAGSLQLGEDDAILVMDAGTGDYNLVASGGFYDMLSTQSPSYVDNLLYDDVQAGKYDQGVEELFGGIHLLMSDTYAYYTTGTGGTIFSVIWIVVLLVVLLIVFSLLDGIRYSLWYGRYGTMGVPPVVYRPILWWHRPGSAWYRRRRNPPPPRGPRGPGPPPPHGRRLWAPSSHGRQFPPSAPQRQLWRWSRRWLWRAWCGQLWRRSRRWFWRQPGRKLWRRPQRRLRRQPGRELRRWPGRRIWRPALTL